MTERLAQLPGWQQSGTAIVKEFTFAGFPEAVAFLSRLVEPSEAADHHPDITIHYRRVLVTFTTHSGGASPRRTSPAPGRRTR